ncbi:hypothetical protein [Labilibacter marinus]|uniref:hypothetical protein n=1 Tax=Labilibacter marinus TaxID=1477105 RepID=UPI00117B0E4B|nr:hypothetical protein [Labilibacter marinus]
MEVNEDPNGIFNKRDIKEQTIPNGFGASRGLMTDAFSLATEGVKMLIDLDKKKYTANYSTGKRQLYFYNYISDKEAVDARGMQFKGVQITRLVEMEKNNIDTAFYIRLVVDTENVQEIVNNSIFRLKVDSLSLPLAKAKIPTFKWYMPWTVFYHDRDQVSFDLTLKLKSSWMDKNGNVARDVLLGSFILNLRDIPLNRESEQYEEYYKNVIGTQLDGYSFLVPRSYGSFVSKDGETKRCYGQGQYNISVSINETGTEHFINKAVQNNSNALIDALTQKDGQDVYNKMLINEMRSLIK